MEKTRLLQPRRRFPADVNQCNLQQFCLHGSEMKRKVVRGDGSPRLTVTVVRFVIMTEELRAISLMLVECLGVWLGSIFSIYGILRIHTEDVSDRRFVVLGFG